MRASGNRARRPASTVTGRDGVAIVVADQRVETVGVGADDGDRARRGAERQQAARVPEQDQALLGHAQRQRAMFRRCRSRRP